MLLSLTILHPIHNSAHVLMSVNRLFSLLAFSAPETHCGGGVACCSLPRPIHGHMLPSLEGARARSLVTEKKSPAEVDAKLTAFPDRVGPADAFLQNVTKVFVFFLFIYSSSRKEVS